MGITLETFDRFINNVLNHQNSQALVVYQEKGELIAVNDYIKKHYEPWVIKKSITGNSFSFMNGSYLRMLHDDALDYALCGYRLDIVYYKNTILDSPTCVRNLEDNRLVEILLPALILF